MQAKLEKAQKKAAAKRHAELVKQADKTLKKGGSRETALKLLQEAFKQQRTPETLLKIAELQYQLDRYAAAVTSANTLILSQPNATILAAAQAVVKRCGVQAKIDEKAAAPPIAPHLNDQLHKSTAASPAPRDPWVAAMTAPRVETNNPWASHTSPSTAIAPAVNRSPSKEAISKADALFARALPAPKPATTPPRQTAIVPAANPFAPKETPAELPAWALPPRPASPPAEMPSWALPPPRPASPPPAHNPFAEEPEQPKALKTAAAPGNLSETSTAMVVKGSSALAQQPHKDADGDVPDHDRTSGATEEILDAD
jgi:hypothetical protein